MVTLKNVAIDHCHCFALRKAARRTTRFYDDVLEPAGLRITQFLILGALLESSIIAVNAMADRLDLDRTTIGKNLRPLEREGLLVVGRSPSDGRSRVASITARGLAAFGTAAPLWKKAQRRFEAMNGSKETSELRVGLDAMWPGT